MRGSPQFQVAPLTPMVKKLIITNVSIWVFLILTVALGSLNAFSGLKVVSSSFNKWFSVVPMLTVENFWIWQPFTYMFLHSLNIFHVVFNMLMLWFLGGELEQRWGSKFFLLYYIVTGVGAAIIYILGCYLYYIVLSGHKEIGPLLSPMVGASGAIFGLILAYGMIFGERIMLFAFIFPMKAKFFVMILGGIEVISLLSSGLSSQVANLAHLGGIIAGFLFLWFWARKKGGKKPRKPSKRRRKLKLVVDNDRQDQPPKYWN